MAHHDSQTNESNVSSAWERGEGEEGGRERRGEGGGGREREGERGREELHEQTYGG